ncbi:MAG TPA: hypothetical protein VGM90_21935 [Kofleriaceae bacterium]
MAGVAVADPHITIRTAKDNSHTVTEPESKKLEGVMRQTIERLVAESPIRLDGNRNVDASLVSLTTDVLDKTIVVSATLKVVVSDDDGKITSMLGGTAKVEAPRRAQVASLREDAIEGAIESGYIKVKAQLNSK